ncbi:hypothetical protein PS1_024000 [Malus domestica]
MAPIDQLASPENHPATSQNPNTYDHNPQSPIVEQQYYPHGFFKKVVAEMIATYMLVLARLLLLPATNTKSQSLELRLQEGSS